MALYRIDVGPAKILPLFRRLHERALREEKELTVSMEPGAVQALEDCKTVIECLSDVECEHSGTGIHDRLNLEDLADSLEGLARDIRHGQ